MWSQWKGNVLVLTMLAVSVVWLLREGEPSDAVIALAGGIIGYIGGIARDLVNPDPAPQVPAHIVEKILDRTG